MALRGKERLVGGKSKAAAISPATMPSRPFRTSNRYTSSRTPDASDSKMVTAVVFRILYHSNIIEQLKHKRSVTAISAFDPNQLERSRKRRRRMPRRGRGRVLLLSQNSGARSTPT